MTEFLLNGEYIPLLGVLWPGPRTPLSPLYPYGDTQDQDQVRTVLGPAGMLDQNGTIGARFHPMMEIISSPIRTVTVTIVRPDHFHVVTRYCAEDPGKNFTCVVDEAGRGRGYYSIALQEIADLCDLEEYGVNDAVAPLDVSLSMPEARVLAAVFDGERNKTGATLAGAKNPGDIAFSPVANDPSTIQNTIRVFEGNERSLFLGTLDSIESIGQAPGDAEITRELDNLTTKELLSRSSSGYEIPEHLLAMVRRSLFPDMAVTTNVTETKNDQPVFMESGQAIRADGTLMLFFRTSGSPDRILLKYLPSDRFLEIFQRLLEDRSYSLTHVAVPETNQKPKTKFCSQCGAQVHAGAQFCNQCGYRFK